MKKYILGIESSCDDTSIAVSCDRKIIANVTANQDIHREYGGVVPELASRAHLQNIVPVIDAAISKAKIQPKDIDAVGFTSGPGLMGSLLVGTSFAKSMALALDVPLIEVNHMQAHILAHFIEKDGMKNPPFPFLCLTVSGGHTQIVKVRDYFDYEIIGQTIDDAVGEAFDKAAKMMQLPYPGGPEIDRHAAKGDPLRFDFSRPKVDGYDFSFSGFKTSLLYFLQAETRKDPEFITKNLDDLCASIQNVLMDILLEKLEKASEQLGISHIAIAGGVSANSELRKRLRAKEENDNWNTYIPDFEYCTDNGAMIAITAYLKYQRSEFSEVDVLATARKPLTE